MTRPRPIAATIRAGQRFLVPCGTLFGAWTDPETRARIEPVPEGLEMPDPQFDARQGATESLSISMDGTEVCRFEQTWLSIAPEAHLLARVDVHMQEGLLYHAQVLMCFTPDRDGARLDITEQVVWPGGTSLQNYHEEAWKRLFANLSREFEPGSPP